MTPQSPHAAQAQRSPSPLVLTNRELIEEADGLARRVAHSTLPLRDAVIVQELATRLGSKS